MKSSLVRCVRAARTAGSIAVLLGAAAAGGCARVSPVAEVRDCLVGAYDSGEQARVDPEYFVISLHMAECWKERTDGPWIYVEQAMAEQADKPYRQRVYRLVGLGGGRVKSVVYELPGKPEEVVKNFAGQWREPQPLKSLTPDKLTERDGCAITLEKRSDGAGWTGSTDGASCLSTLRGAAWATSEVELSSSVLRSWDRGFDSAGKQVWGAKKGPYVFVKKVSRAEGSETNRPTVGGTKSN